MGLWPSKDDVAHALCVPRSHSCERSEFAKKVLARLPVPAAHIHDNLAGRADCFIQKAANSMNGRAISWAAVRFLTAAVPLIMLRQPGAVDAFDDAFDKTVRPFLAKSCYGCHNDRVQSGSLNLQSYDSAFAVGRDRERWERVAEKLRTRQMPPPGMPPPANQEVQRVTAWINAEFERADRLRRPDPGHITVRRLNRAEYANTVRDLLGVDFQPAADFPPDDSGYGFDDIGEVLSVSPLLLERYLLAAENVARTAVYGPARSAPSAIRHPNLAKIYSCGHLNGKHNAACARTIVTHLAERAYRRPVEEAEIGPLLKLISLARANGDSLEEGLCLALQKILISPYFIFRIEKPGKARRGEPLPVSDYAMASRLSYFLWSSMPDDELFRLAGQGQLGTPGVLADQVKRMLRDPKARALATNFGGQWLQFRGLESHVPDRKKFPRFTPYLRACMQKETESFFEYVMREDLPITDFLDAKYTFVNGRLANFYGIPGVTGAGFRKVDLTGTARRGVLTQASVLTVSSYPNRTSPVLRGKWILENILNSPPPPPPGNVPRLDDKAVGTSASLRAQLEQHRSNAVCASCHARIDPLGFALENYDAIGAWRAKDGKFEIDSRGRLPDGREFLGANGLIEALLPDRGAFARCVTEKMLIYALGRGLARYDRPAEERIVSRLAVNNYRFSTLVLEIVKSLPFQQRREEFEN